MLIANIEPGPYLDAVVALYALDWSWHLVDVPPAPQALHWYRISPCPKSPGHEKYLGALPALSTDTEDAFRWLADPLECSLGLKKLAVGTMARDCLQPSVVSRLTGGKAKVSREYPVWSAKLSRGRPWSYGPTAAAALAYATLHGRGITEATMDILPEL